MRTRRPRPRRPTIIGGHNLAQLPIVAAVIMGIAAMILASVFGDWPGLPFGRDGKRTAQKRAASAYEGPPRVAVVVGELGASLDVTVRQALALPWPLTFAVRAGSAHAAEIAALAHGAGREVVVQLALESDDPPAERVRELLALALATVPHAAGVSQEMGSRATADSAFMLTLLREVRARRLYYLDCHATPASVACETARRVGAGCVENDLFLDTADDFGTTDVREWVLALERIARERGWAVGMARAQPATPGALRGVLGELERRGVRLVPAGSLAAELTAASAPS